MTEVPPPAPIQVGGHGPAGGYEFSHDEVGNVINQWKSLLDNLNKDVGNAETIAGVQPPGTEFASGDFINKGANPSGQTLLEQHQRMVTYVTNYITALEAARDKITVAEEEARQAAATSGKGV